MTNRQLNFENIDKVENLNYTPLEKKYLTLIPQHYYKIFFLST